MNHSADLNAVILRRGDAVLVRAMVAIEPGEHGEQVYLDTACGRHLTVARASIETIVSSCVEPGDLVVDIYGDELGVALWRDETWVLVARDQHDLTPLVWRRESVLPVRRSGP